MKGYSASDRAAAVRIVDCPSCRAAVGQKCHYVAAGGLGALPTVTHKRIVDKFFKERFGQLELKQ